jgi:hypothetical protein
MPLGDLRIESKSKRRIERAVAYLYVKETQSSFGIEALSGQG